MSTDKVVDMEAARSAKLVRDVKMVDGDQLAVVDMEAARSTKLVRDVRMVDGDQLVGKTVVLWRNETRQPAKVESIDKGKCKIRYKLLAGPDQGKVLKNRYDASQTVVVYEEGARLLAFLDA